MKRIIGLFLFVFPLACSAIKFECASAEEKIIYSPSEVFVTRILLDVASDKSGNFVWLEDVYKIRFGESHETSNIVREVTTTEYAKDILKLTKSDAHYDHFETNIVYPAQGSPLNAPISIDTFKLDKQSGLLVFATWELEKIQEEKKANHDYKFKKEFSTKGYEWKLKSQIKLQCK